MRSTLLLSVVLISAKAAHATCMDDAQAWLALCGTDPSGECYPTKQNWCSDKTCFAAGSKYYDSCKSDPIQGAAANATKQALESLGCEPTFASAATTAKAILDAANMALAKSAETKEATVE